MNEHRPFCESGAALCRSLPLETRLALARAWARAYDAGLHKVFEQVLVATADYLPPSKEVNK